MKAPLTHIYQTFSTDDLNVQRRHSIARESWDLEYATGLWKSVPVSETDFKRTSKTELGDTRSCPFIKDIFDLGCSKTPEGGMVVFTNTDSCLRMGISVEILWHLRKGEKALYSHRIDFPRINGLLNPCAVREGRWYDGRDLFAFTPAWWRSVRDDFPDLLIGYECWDLVLGEMMIIHGFAEIHEGVAHELHDRFWLSNRLTSPVNKYCIREARRWLLSHKRPLRELVNVPADCV